MSFNKFIAFGLLLFGLVFAVNAEAGILANIRANCQARQEARSGGGYSCQCGSAGGYCPCNSGQCGDRSCPTAATAAPVKKSQRVTTNCPNGNCRRGF